MLPNKKSPAPSTLRPAFAERSRRRMRVASRPQAFLVDADGGVTEAALTGPRPMEIPARPFRDVTVEREVFCAHYAACLSEASRNGWDDFTCKRCPIASRVATPSAVRFANDRPGGRE